MKVYYYLLLCTVFICSCSPSSKTTFIRDSEQYGVIYDNRFNAPISYKPRYLELHPKTCQPCAINTHVVDNLHFTRTTRAFECSEESLYTDHYVTK